VSQRWNRVHCFPNRNRCPFGLFDSFSIILRTQAPPLSLGTESFSPKCYNVRWCAQSRRSHPRHGLPPPPSSAGACEQVGFSLRFFLFLFFFFVDKRRGTQMIFNTFFPKIFFFLSFHPCYGSFCKQIKTSPEVGSSSAADKLPAYRRMLEVSHK
jgi:hypothetical protein